MKKTWNWIVIIALMITMAGCGKAISGPKQQEQGNGAQQQADSAKPSASTASSASSASSAPKSDSAQYVFKLGHLQTTDHPYQKGAEKFKQIVEEKSGGRIQIDIFPSSQLGNARDEIEGLQLGTIQFHVGSVAPVANFAPKLNVLSLPYLFRDKNHALKVLDGDIGKELSADLESKGIVNLAYWENGWRHMTNNVRPIKSAADVKGLKIRVLESPVYVSFVKALGATPTPIPFGELYSAMEQKVVDGQENPLAQITQNKFNEVQKYMTLTAHTYDAAVFLVSKSALDKLPADLQKIVKDAAVEAGNYERQLNAQLDEGFMKKLKSAGMVIEEKPDLDSFRKAVEPVYKEFEGKLGKDLIDKIRSME
ncbi:TRAP transporter substrate-binding protein [Ferviditalea candida]|uniref:DctP family TRAP transporter solute-binding subunit n=1 Tax=Ferviditalea candida TaxID=3108399 RepID=A0ABU5ZH42_9BACL|nr:DctP family TRAP transporter solute-binding subunit [Paenibacillaceae bacterium T2]